MPAVRARFRGWVQRGHRASLAATIRALPNVAETAEPFRYPTAQGVLRSVDEFRQAYLPAYYDVDQIGERMKRTVELICAHRPDSPLRMLDYGSGVGTFAYHVAKRRPSWTVEGWDGDSSSLQVARECFTIENTSFELRPYDSHGDLEPDSYDVITFLEVIEHVDNPGEILSNFSRALRPGGLLVVSTPNAFGRVAVTQEIWRRFRDVVRRRDGRELARRLADRAYDATTHEGHVVIYNIETLTTLIAQHGMKAVDIALVPFSNRPHHRLVPDTIVVLAEPAGARSG